MRQASGVPVPGSVQCCDGYVHLGQKCGRCGTDWPAGVVPSQAQSIEHCANEWADMATSGLQWLRNIRDGVSTVEAATANMETLLAHCKEVAAGVQPSQAQSNPQWGVQVNLDEEAAGLLSAMIGGMGDDEPARIVLSVGDGAAGWGLYVWLEEHPEEGALLLRPLPRPGTEPSGLCCRLASGVKEDRKCPR